LRGETPELRSRLDVISNDMGIVSELTRAQHVAAPVTGAAERLYRVAMAAHDDSVVATRLMEEH
jgi:3-hydroxyisobutyrate dehydrogenase-like beta-hydroxyacid dehydrogenase